MAPEDPIHAGAGNTDRVIAFQVPNDANRTHVVCSAQMQDFLYHFWWRLVRHLMRDGLLLNQPRIALRLIGSSPQVEG